MYLVCQVEDIGERRASGEALAHQAVHDPLTGLPNRLQFVERLGRELARAEQRRERIAVLFLDLDRFKVVNDSLGHSAGDRLLVAVADRLSSVMGPADVVARFGGDEFTILCHDVSSEETVELIAERIAEAIARPVALDGGRGVRDREHRHRALRQRRRHARDAGAQRRRRDVPRQGARPRPRRAVRRQRAPPRGRRPAHRQRAAPRHRAR